MTSLKLSNVKSLINWSLRTIAELTMPATLGRDSSFFLKDVICSWSDMSVCGEQMWNRCQNLRQDYLKFDVVILTIYV